MILRTVCPHDCPDCCSIRATVEDGRVVAVAGDPEPPFTRGFLCGKVTRYQERVHSPERLLRPLRRRGPKGSGDFVPISWDNALDEIASHWQEILARHGSEALVGYVYSGHQGLVNRNISRALFHALGASRFLAGTVCDSTAERAWEYTVGQTPGTDPESVVDSDLIVCWGANVVSANVHLVPSDWRTDQSPLPRIDANGCRRVSGPAGMWPGRLSAQRICRTPGRPRRGSRAALPPR